MIGQASIGGSRLLVGTIDDTTLDSLRVGLEFLIRVGGFVVGSISLDNGVVGDVGVFVDLGGGGSPPQKRTHGQVPEPDGVILSDRLAVQPRNEEDGGESGQAEAGTESDRDDPPPRLLVQAELRGSLVDDGKCADCSSDQEEEWRSVDCPRHGSLSEMDDELDEHENRRSEATGDERSET